MLALKNFQYRFLLKGKHIFVPTEECISRGEDIAAHVNSVVEFPDCFYHFRQGGHVAALHKHLDRRYFFRIDLKNFFYSISKNQVIAALRATEFPLARKAGKWSTVRNPYGNPPYALPIGFVQSPALASLVLYRSTVMQAITRAAAIGIFCSVYFDDIICSHDDIEALAAAFSDLKSACAEARLPINPDKLLTPAERITAFNCALERGFAEVTPERVAKFMAASKGPLSEAAFDRYCAKVAERNPTSPV